MYLYQCEKCSHRDLPEKFIDGFCPQCFIGGSDPIKVWVELKADDDDQQQGTIII